MTRARRTVLLGWALAGLLLACEEQPATDSSSSALPVTPSAATPTSSIRAPGERYADDDVPVAADFEEEAASTIDASNHLEALRELEEAIGGGSPAPSASTSSSPPPPPRPRADRPLASP